MKMTLDEIMKVSNGYTEEAVHEVRATIRWLSTKAPNWVVKDLSERFNKVEHELEIKQGLIKGLIELIKSKEAYEGFLNNLLDDVTELLDKSLSENMKKDPRGEKKN